MCDASSVRMPKIRIVNALAVGTMSDLTAEVHFPLRGRPIMNVPLRVVQEYPRKAFDYLVTHEVGHVARKDQRLRVCKAVLLTLMFLVIAASVLAGFSGAYSELIMGQPGSGLRRAQLHSSSTRYCLWLGYSRSCAVRSVTRISLLRSTCGTSRARRSVSASQRATARRLRGRGGSPVGYDECSPPIHRTRTDSRRCGPLFRTTA